MPIRTPRRLRCRCQRLGVPLASLVPELCVFAPYKQPSSWRKVLYRPFVELYAEDENVVRRALEPVMGPPSSVRMAS